MDPQAVLESLKSLCRDIDAGRALRRISLQRLVVPLAIPAAMGLAAAPIGCGSHTEVEETNCTDDIDNDGDGDIDCADEDCRNGPDCAIPPYGIPWEDDCGDGLDNDDDGYVDCFDTDCAEVCPEICDDGIDNDADGMVDCEDTDCAGSPMCDALLYGAPFG